MMSIASHDNQLDVLSGLPVVGNDIIRFGSDNRANVVSSLNSTVLTHLPARCSFPPSCCPCRALMIVSGCDQFYMLPTCLESFPLAQTHRSHITQVSGPSNFNQLSSAVLCESNMIPPTSHLSNPCHTAQVFIKSVRNTSISIHIDSTSSISDLKHLIYVHDGIPPCDHRLMHRGRELRDDALLSDLDLDGATITCLLRVLGGNHSDRIPLPWWFGFSRSYQDGRAGEEGRICHVLSEIELDGARPENWYSAQPLSDWVGVRFHPGIVLFNFLMLAGDTEVLRIYSIKLYYSNVISLPECISDLTSLTVLYFSDCKLAHLPDSIGKLSSLRVLYLNSNRISHLPDSIGDLSYLAELYLNSNRLTSLPDSISNLTSLTVLSVGSNPITSTIAGKAEVKRRFERVGLTVHV